MFNIVNGTSLRELNFLTSILAVRMDRKRYYSIFVSFMVPHVNFCPINFMSYKFIDCSYRLIVLFKEQTYIYDVNSLEKKQIIDTVPNVQGDFEILYFILLQSISCLHLTCSASASKWFLTEGTFNSTSKCILTTL